MMRKSWMLLAIVLSIFPAIDQKPEFHRPKPETSTINFCDLLRNPDCYDGKEVKIHAKYLSTFEVSAFVDSSCTDMDSRAWVEFDRISISASAKPEILQKIKQQVYCCMWGGDNYLRETKMLVKGIFHKPNKEGYGHDNKYRFMVTVKGIEEIGDTKKIKVPGFDESP
jgi:hypothetical protein